MMLPLRGNALLLKIITKVLINNTLTMKLV
nr:MAG TPA: hypothetical protein [Crassvirales sp.]